MLQQMYESNVLIYIMVGLCIIGVVTKVITGVVYQSTLQASQNIGETGNRWIKQILMRFETSYQLKMNVNNVDKFVDKYVYRRKFMWIHLYTLENMSGKMLILSLMTGMAGAFLAYVTECGQTTVLYTLAVGVAGAGMLMLFEVFINVGQKKEIIKANIEDYLENYLKVKLEYEVFAPDELEKYQREYFEERPAQAEKMKICEDGRREEKGQTPAAATGTKGLNSGGKEEKRGCEIREEDMKERIVTEILEEFLF